MSFVEVLKEDELWLGEMRRVYVGSTPVLLLRVAEGVFAYEDRCAHLGIALSSGTLQDCVVTCRAHRYEYDARTGSGLNPRGQQLVAFRTECRNGSILVEAKSPQPAGAR
jgi:toluene monooxygenase system ferredoxin subunit